MDLDHTIMMHLPKDLQGLDEVVLLDDGLGIGHHRLEEGAKLVEWKRNTEQLITVVLEPRQFVFVDQVKDFWPM
jgi:hypothetical protein